MPQKVTERTRFLARLEFERATLAAYGKAAGKEIKDGFEKGKRRPL